MTRLTLSPGSPLDPAADPPDPGAPCEMTEKEMSFRRRSVPHTPAIPYFPEHHHHPLVAHFLSSLSRLSFFSPQPLGTSQASVPLWENNKGEDTHQSEGTVSSVKLKSFTRTELDLLPDPLSSRENLESA